MIIDIAIRHVCPQYLNKLCNNKIFLFQHTQSFPTYLSIILKLSLEILPVVQTILIYLLGIISIMMIATSLISTLWILKRQEEQEQETIKTIDNPDMRIPLYNGQYTAIKILPTIKKITSRTELFT